MSTAGIRLTIDQAVAASELLQMTTESDVAKTAEREGITDEVKAFKQLLQWIHDTRWHLHVWQSIFGKDMGRHFYTTKVQKKKTFTTMSEVRYIWQMLDTTNKGIFIAWYNWHRAETKPRRISNRRMQKETKE